MFEKFLHMRVHFSTGIDAVRQTKGVAEAALCYTGDLTANGGGKYNIDYYLNLAKVFCFRFVDLMYFYSAVCLLSGYLLTSLLSKNYRKTVKKIVA
jgi:pyruvate carboxylase